MAMAFEDNIYYRYTIVPQLTQVEDLSGRLSEIDMVE